MRPAPSSDWLIGTPKSLSAATREFYWQLAADCRLLQITIAVRIALNRGRTVIIYR